MNYENFTVLLKTVIEKKDNDFLLKFLEMFKSEMITVKNKYNYTPLHNLMNNISKCSNPLEILKMFHREMTSLKGEGNYTPLHNLMNNISECSNQLEILEMFCNEIITVKINGGYTSLHLLMTKQFSKCENQLEILKMFCSEIITVKNMYNQTPLFWLMRNQFNECSDEVKKEIVKLFRDHLTDYEDKIKDYIEPELETNDELVVKVKRGTVVRIEYID